MRGPWRRLMLAAAIYVTVGAGTAAAQTVIVRNAPSGSPVDLSYNGKVIASAVADDHGQATLPVNLQANAGKAEVDLRILADLCPKQQHVMLVQPGLEVVAPAEGCGRHEIAGVFALRGITTLLVDLSSTKPAVWLRQGPMPPEWMSEEAPENAKPERLLPTGLVLFGGGGIGYINSFARQACGDVTGCGSKSTRPAFSVGLTYWLNRYLGVQANFVKPTNLSAKSGSETSYQFDSTFNARTFALAANVGIPIGPVRLYALGGGDYHQAIFTTNTTIPALTYTIDDVTTTVPGGTQTTAMETRGWGWLVGGGMEGWVSNRVAIYGEGGTETLRGKARDRAEGAADSRAVYLVAGIKLHIGR